MRRAGSGHDLLWLLAIKWIYCLQRFKNRNKMYQKIKLDIFLSLYIGYSKHHQFPPSFYHHPPPLLSSQCVMKMLTKEWMYTFIKTHHIVHLKLMCFILGKLNLKTVSFLNWSLVALQCCVSFSVHLSESATRTHTSPVCHHQALSRVPCGIQ